MLYLLITIIICFLQSCTFDKNNLDKIPYIQKSTSSISLKGESVNDDIIFIPPSQIELIDDFLLLYRSGGGCTAQILNLSKNEQVNSFGKMGQGPDEQISPFFAGTDSVNKKIYIWDISLMRMSEYEYFIQNGNLNFKRGIHHQQSNNSIYCFTSCKVNNYFVGQVASGTNNSKQFILLDKNQKIITEFGEIPFSDQLTDLIKLRGTMCSFDSQFVMGGMSYSYIVSYEIESPDKIIKKWEYLIDKPKYSIEKGQIVWKDENPYGFMDIKMNSKYIFALYRGKPFNPTKDGALSKTLHILSHEGNLIHTFDLDKTCIRIAVSDENIVYAISIDADSEIVKYDLRDYL